ncbi:TcfC E-set like domain-containing protein [Microbulbifer sp. DLAB2-AA]|uniref:TcfC E-set like domain-containing protein n=1 Tax=Microbulbifer sp. DLAB2-AA TaxID=3243394 RepID=UPI00403A1FC9
MAGRLNQWHALAFCLAQAIHADSFATTAATFLLETSAPEGFDSLTEPQQLLVDLYYGGRQIGAAPITVDPTHIQFDEPEQLLPLLPKLLDRKTVIAALADPLPRNSQYLCRSSWQRKCGYLAPEQVAVIYDENRYRLDLFFSAKLLPQEAAISDPYLPASTSEFSIVQNLSGAWSGVESNLGENSHNATLNGNTIISFGESALHVQWSAATAQHNQISALHWSRDYRGRAYSIGLLQPQGGWHYFGNHSSLYGLEMRSSQLSRTDIKYRQGSPLEINMPVRGRVEIYRDQRLIHTEMLEAGNRLLNTSTLPHGSYEIEVRTFDEMGRSLHSHSEFFTKDSLLPAPGEWSWNFYAGQPANNYSNYQTLPERYQDVLAQGSIARRLSGNLGFFASAASTREQQLYEIGARWISGFFEVSPSIVTNKDGRSGHRVQALLKTPFATLSAIDARLDDAADFDQTKGLQLLPLGYSQRSLALQSNLLGGQLSLRLRERDSGYRLLPGEQVDKLDNASKLTSLSFKRNFLQSAKWLGSATFSHHKADGQQYTGLEIELRRRAKHWQHSANINSERSNHSDHEQRLLLESRWHDRDLWAAEFEQQITAEKSRHGRYLESSSHLAGHFGYLNSTLTFNNVNHSKAFNYLGGFRTNLIVAENTFAWGGERALESAVVIEIDGSDQQNFEVLVDGNRRGYAKGGDRSVINLPAFQSYDLSLRPLDNGFFDYREQSKTFTLYPGNVNSTTYQIEQQLLILGRLTDMGEGLPNTPLFIGEHSTTTDRYGVFQLSINTNKNNLLTQALTWDHCQAPINILSSGDSWLNLGSIEQSKANCHIETTARLTSAQH